MTPPASVETLHNFIGGRWVPSSGRDALDVFNPAKGVVIARTPLSTANDVDSAVAAATKAYPEWSETPPVARAQSMFKFKALLETHFEELAHIVTTEHGKTLDESRGSVRRGIECVEVACGAPSMMMGYGLENVSRGIDCQVMRQPIGVCAAISPFNFPAMVPLWFLPFAVVCGNTFVLKPSEQVPLSQQRLFELLAQCDLPAGVVNLVNGGREVVEAICDHPGIRGVSFVGSFPTGDDAFNRRFAVTTDLRLVPTSKVKPDTASTWHGVEINDALPLPFGPLRSLGQFGCNKCHCCGAARIRNSSSNASCWVMRAMSSRRRPDRSTSNAGRTTPRWPRPG